MSPIVSIIMGSTSDLPVMEKAAQLLNDLHVPFEMNALSAHRTPEAVEEFAKGARKRGIKVIIAAAGMAAALPGVIAANTTLPVIGVPIKGSVLDGVDALYSIIQMPPGIPVATVAINGAMNAAILAIQMLALSDEKLAEAFAAYKEGLKKNKYNLSQSVENLYLTYLDSIRHTDSKNKYVTMNSAEKIITKQFIQKEVSQSDIAIITIGRISGEGEDRNPENYFSLSEIETQLIKNVCDAYHAANKKVIVILNIGGVIETASWKDYPDAILLAWQAGQQGGNAIVDILSGKVTPSGKLPVSFPIAYSDVPSSSFFPGIPKKDPINSFYNEGIYVGYKFYETAAEEGLIQYEDTVQYPFGYGLTYGTAEVISAAYDQKSKKVSYEIVNRSDRAVEETVQVYKKNCTSKWEVRNTVLCGFAKVCLAPGETRQGEIQLDEYAFTVVNDQGKRVQDGSDYLLYVGTHGPDKRSEELTGTKTIALDIKF